MASGDLLRPAQMGNLQRVVASLESTLDIYRLGLAELVLAGELLADLGEEPGARADRAIPENAREVFGRLARVLSSRVPADALAPIPRGYHYEALDSLEKLAAAERLGEVRVPLAELVRALEELVGVADDVVDLFSRQRPIQVQIFDADTALAQIQDAIDQVGVAERRILQLRKREAEISELYQAYLFLEISLGNMLDVIAAAEEAGVNVGFELQLALDSFKEILARVKTRTETLRAVVDRMDTPPTVEPRSGLAWWIDGTAQEATITLELRQRGAGAFAGWRVEGVPRFDSMREQLIERLRCRSSLGEEPGLRNDPVEVPIESEPFLIGTYPASETPLRIPILEGHRDFFLRVSAVTAFGTPSEPIEVDVARLPATAEPPARLYAEAVEVSPFEPAFYEDYDLVKIHFAPSPNDLSAELAGRADGVSLVTAYELYRGETRVATLSPGQTELVDRADPKWLTSGATYRLVTRTSDGHELTTPSCPAFDTVVADRQEELTLAIAGAEFLERPSTIEREVEGRLRADAVKREQLLEELAGDPAREALLDRWWNSISDRRRLAWLDDWVELQGGVDSDWFRETPEISSRDRDWVIAAMWLEEQEPALRREVARLWKLLHPSERAELERAWFESRSPAWRATLEEQLRAADEVVRSGILEPVRIAHWVATKDPQERELLFSWWEQKAEEERSKTLREWLASQPAGLRRELRWPQNEALGEDELAARLQTAHHALPPALAPQFLAWWRFEQLEGDELRRAIAADVGALNVMRARLHYAVRPFDVATDFNAYLIFIGLLILVPIALFWLRGRHKRVRRIVAPPPGVAP